MNLTRIEGPATIQHCDGCDRNAIAGTEQYESASTGEQRQPEEWYTDGGVGVYCAACAAKLVEADPTRSVSRYFLDTAGTVVDPAHL